MIEINDTYYAKDTIQKISQIIEVEDAGCIGFFVYILIGNELVMERVYIDNENDNSSTRIKYLRKQLITKLSQWNNANAVARTSTQDTGANAKGVIAKGSTLIGQSKQRRKDLVAFTPC